MPGIKGSKVAQKGSNPDNTFDVIFPGASQKAAFTGASTPVTNPFAANVSVVRLYSTQDCYVKFGAAPVATSADMFLPGGVTEYIGVNPGDKVAAIQDTAAGTLYVTEGAA